MKSLEIQGTFEQFFTPTVKFNAVTGICWIEGESYLEEAFEFYGRLTQWVNEYFKENEKPLELNIKLRYFNTSSSRALIDFLRNLKKHKDQTDLVVVKWHYPDPDDDELLLEAEDLMDETGLEFTLVKYQD